MQNQEHYMQGVVARRDNFTEPILEFLEAAWKEFGELTGRYYGPVTEYKTEVALERVALATCPTPASAARLGRPGRRTRRPQHCGAGGFSGAASSLPDRGYDESRRKCSGVLHVSECKDRRPALVRLRPRDAGGAHRRHRQEGRVAAAGGGVERRGSALVRAASHHA